MARSTCSLVKASGAGAKPSPALWWLVAPRLVVRMIRQWRKSATWPSASVSRPSSNTCRNRSQMRGCAFSNSSSRTTENGCLRTRLISESVSAARLPSPRIFGRRVRRSGTRSCRAGSCRSTEPNRYSAVVLASSVLPVPVGPANRNTPIGRPGSFNPALSMAMRSTTLVTASSWPITRLEKKPRIEARSRRSLLSRIETGRPVSWDKRLEHVARA